MRQLVGSGDELGVRFVSAGVGDPLWRHDGQYAFVEISQQFIEIEIIAEAKLKLIVVLHGFEVKALPVDPYDMRLARSDDEIRAAGGDFYPACFHSRYEHGHF